MKFNLSTILAVATALSTASLSAASSIPNGGALKERGHCNPQWRGSYRYCDSDHRPQHEGEEPTKSPGCSTDGHNYAWRRVLLMDTQAM
ncbi:hypothetical protein PHISCL_08107 [Aspergillus sclerotialis]|uniref:Uncharacterized protein n=1 Tax=Aspergillus sclerotialis TaxID=2070753 RepID=A0A3A2Z8V1_9EURO|nr:hypothetical protein PHISCL_08107 [Aspergillus sclerotialis]